MFRPRVIPVLLLKDKGLVKTVKFKDGKYVGDPINAVRIFNNLKADELIFLDIQATKENRISSLQVIQNIGDEAFMPFSVGGGIRTIDDIKQIINAGAEKVIINTAAVETPELITEAANLFGSQSVIVSIDVKKNIFGKYKVYTKNGTKSTNLAPIKHAQNMEKLGAGEIMINSIEKDGTLSGYDIDIINQICNSVDIPVIACGGCGKYEDLTDAVKLGNASAVAAGSIFVFHGARKAVLVNYPDRELLGNLFSFFNY